MRRTLRYGLLLLPLAALALPSGAKAQDSALHKYEGRWNYIQPVPATGVNLATITPGTTTSPQVGDIVLTRRGDTIVGRTDVGCTWTFTGDAKGLHLTPAAQTCHNPTYDVWYTITTWTIRVQGDHEWETLKATSPIPGGSVTWRLNDGERTKTQEYAPGRVASFLGTWRYGAPDQATGWNLVATYTGSAPTYTPETGTVTITGDYQDRMTATTPDGCTWSLIARGTTAHLDPAVQTCGNLTLHYWAISTDGTRQYSSLAGTNTAGAPFVLNTATLTRTG